MSYIIRRHSSSVHMLLPLRDHFTPEARVHWHNHLTLLFIAPESSFFFLITKKRKKKNLVTFLSQKRISVFCPWDIPKDFKSQRIWYEFKCSILIASFNWARSSFSQVIWKDFLWLQNILEVITLNLVLDSMP